MLSTSQVGNGLIVRSSPKQIESARVGCGSGPIEPKVSENGPLFFQTELTGEALERSVSGATVMGKLMLTKSGQLATLKVSSDKFARGEITSGLPEPYSVPGST